MTTPAKRLGLAIEDWRGRRGWSQEDLRHQLQGEGIATARRLEQAARRDDQGAADPGRPRAQIFASLDRAFSWVPGSAAACWDTGAPPKEASHENVSVIEVDVMDSEVRALLAIVSDVRLTPEERRQRIRVAIAAMRALD